MKNNLYVIFDNEAKSFGDVLSFNNDDEATRFFIYSCSNCEWYKDLRLLYLGTIKTSDAMNGVLIESEPTYFKDVCLGENVFKEVDELRKKRVEIDTLRSEIAKSIQQPQFVDDVKKLSRYLSKTDKKRFNK